MIQMSDGLMVLTKRQPRSDEGAEVFIVPDAITAVEPHRTGCYVYAAGQRWDVAHSHTEIIHARRLRPIGR